MKKNSRNSATLNSFFEVEVVMGNITKEKTTAIVNAANSHLAHSGGVAGAILQAGGSQIQ